MPYFQRDNASLFYVSGGKGQPILFLHGWACDSQDFVFQIPFFQSLNYRTIAFDARGHGRSSIPSVSDPEQLRPEVTSDDATALLEHLDITQQTPVIVVGHSLGCLTASLLAVRSPELVKALVLIDPMYYQTAAAHAGFTKALSGGRSHEVLAHSFATKSVTKDTPEWLKTWHRMRLLGTPEWVVFQTAYQKNVVEPAIGNWEVCRDHLAKRNCPRLVVLKDKDNMEKEKGLGSTRADRFEIVGAGHWLHVQEADRFNAIVQEWSP
ncbi:putative Alpha/Beta hydrolase protein [Seiridium cardinale]|uniref:Alpha/Beta hydrolase protein n=1 Tax=Seiridium cardinale TaxID=138064 RepID=A0ABR2XTK4_9PEZI